VTEATTADRKGYRAAVLAFGEIAGALNEAVERQELLRLIARHVCELTGIGRCSVYLREERSGLFRGQAGYDRDQELPREEGDRRIQRLVCGVDADRFTQEIVATRRPVIVANAASDTRPIRSAMRTWGVRSMLGVPMLAHGEVVGIIFLDDAARAHRFSDEECELASAFADMAALVIQQANLSARMRQSLRTVARQNDLLRKAAAMDERLTELVLDGGNLAEIAGAASELTGKPVDIYDPSGRRLARAVPEGVDEASVPAPLEPPTREVPEVVAALEGLGARGSGIVGPFLEAGLRYRFIVAPIVVRDDVSGTVVVVEQGTRFAALDLHIARRAATNAALELVAERRAARAEWDARAALAGELIRGSGDHGALTRRAEFLGVELDAPHLLCLIAPGADGGPPPPGARELADAFDAAVLASGVNEGALVVLRLPRGVAALDAVAQARADVSALLARAAPGRRLYAALSTVCARVGDYPAAFGEARRVLSCARSLVGGGEQGGAAGRGERAADGAAVVLAADDLGAGRLLLGSTTREEADRFVADTLGPLMVPGDAGAADLLETLRVFIAEQRSVRRAARALDVHENTIRYRLARVEQLTGLAVATDSDDQLAAQMALLIVWLRSLGATPA
jgi:sugar diacid utilization regulator